MLFHIAFKAIISTMAFVGKLFTKIFFNFAATCTTIIRSHWSVSQDLQSFDFFLIYSQRHIHFRHPCQKLAFQPPRVPNISKILFSDIDFCSTKTKFNFVFILGFVKQNKFCHDIFEFCLTKYEFYRTKLNHAISFAK